MSIMRQALERAKGKTDNESFKGMVDAAAEKANVSRRHSTKKRLPPAKEYEARIKRTRFVGIGSLRPCTLLDWPDATPALADGRPCRIGWGLSDGSCEQVVVLLEYPMAIQGTDSHTHYALFSVKSLAACNCKGYIHTRVCKP